MDSTNDDRTVNNVVRHEYKVLSENEKTDMTAIKDGGADLIRRIDTLESRTTYAASRELELARQRVEEAVFWAVKHITK